MFVIKCKPFLLSILVPIFIAFLAGIIILPDIGIYSTLTLPPGSPPGFVFPIVWTALYILMGISSYGIFTSQSNFISISFWIYSFQLALNFFWPIIFFKSQLYLFAFIWLLILIACILLMIKIFTKVNKISAYLLIPYILWCIYAAYLNLGIVILN